MQSTAVATSPATISACLGRVPRQRLRPAHVVLHVRVDVRYRVHGPPAVARVPIGRERRRRAAAVRRRDRRRRRQRAVRRRRRRRRVVDRVHDEGVVLRARLRRRAGGRGDRRGRGRGPAHRARVAVVGSRRRGSRIESRRRLPREGGGHAVARRGEARRGGVSSRGATKGRAAAAAAAAAREVASARGVLWSKRRRRRRLRRDEESERRSGRFGSEKRKVRPIQTFFTRRSVSTFDRVPFQLTGELFLYGMALRSCLGLDDDEKEATPLLTVVRK